MISSKD